MWGMLCAICIVLKDCCYVCTYSMHVTEFAYKCDKGIFELNFELQHVHHCYTYVHSKFQCNSNQKLMEGHLYKSMYLHSYVHNNMGRTKHIQWVKYC